MGTWSVGAPPSTGVPARHPIDLLEKKLVNRGSWPGACPDVAMLMRDHKGRESVSTIG